MYIILGINPSFILNFSIKDDGKYGWQFTSLKRGTVPIAICAIDNITIDIMDFSFFILFV
jgi:hypothetical protein